MHPLTARFCSLQSIEKLCMAYSFACMMMPALCPKAATVITVAVCFKYVMMVQFAWPSPSLTHRFKSLHCHLHPEVDWCAKNRHWRWLLQYNHGEFDLITSSACIGQSIWQSWAYITVMDGFLCIKSFILLWTFVCLQHHFQVCLIITITPSFTLSNLGTRPFSFSVCKGLVPRLPLIQYLIAHSMHWTRVVKVDL